MFLSAFRRQSGMLKRLPVLVFALLSATAGGARAADLYAGAGLGGTVESGSFRESLEPYADAEGDAWKLFAGIRMGRHLAIEVGHHDLGEQRCCRGFADLGFASAVDGVSAAALGRWPLGRWAPFVKVGVLAWEEDGQFITLIGPTPRSADGTDLLLGAGFDLELTARFAIRGEWERYEFGGTSSDGVWASVLLRLPPISR